MGRETRTLPIGQLTVEDNGRAVTRIEFTGPADAGSDAPSALTRRAFEQLEAYCAGQLRTFDLPLEPQGTAFQKRVWAALCEIPYGQTRSYGEIARAVGCPGGARAVGMANNRNRIVIAIPCHRVIGANGALVGYSDGLDVKAALLTLEGASFSAR